jgi:AcrR family transcriptional regulator
MAGPRADPRIAASRAAILDATTELLCEKGLSAVTIDDVVDRSGVARATLYRHWPSRRALLLDGLAALMKASPTPPPEGDLTKRLAIYLTAQADQFSSHSVSISRVLPSLLEAARNDPEFADQMPAFHNARRAPLHAIIRDAKASGEINPHVDPDTALAELVGPLLFRRLILGDPLDEAFRHTIIADFLAAHGTTRPAQKQKRARIPD